ncbi:MAG TPA: acyltransferase family protein [Casimicrobiaceae bacterium]|nr:acyltransferase family protein [Casimicrobiaceae bacterium]
MSRRFLDMPTSRPLNAAGKHRDAAMRGREAPHTSGDYRPDVDGLRAIAVLSVIFFHLDKKLLPGGFVGVDIFFVISGFLITRNILREIEHGRFSLLEFYRRRVKRIAPAMLVVVGATLFLAELLMLPEDARSAAKSAVASVASLANVYFWLYTGDSYFAIDTSQLPLLHLWSLGVEEQFYLFWPLALMLLYRSERAARFAAGVVVVAVASFALGQALVDAHPQFAYYMLPTRAGELALGALVALAVVKHAETRWPKMPAASLAGMGLIMLLASLLLLSDRVSFPGWLAVPPTLGTAMIIFAGHCRTNAVSRGLAMRGLVEIGLVSYSAYLWHWPLLALYRYGYGEIGLAPGATLFLATMALAWMSYRFVEIPARRSRERAPRVIARQYVVPGGIVVLFALVTLYPAPTGLLGLHSDAFRQRLARVRLATAPALAFDWACQRQRLALRDTRDERCVLGAPKEDEPRAILWGDSNAAHYIGMIEVFAKQAGFRFRNVEVGSCPPLRSDARRFVEPARQRDCVDSLHLVAPVVDRFDVVMMAASWTAYQATSGEFLPALFETAQALASSGKLVILIGKVPEIPGYDRRCREKSLSYPFLACPESGVPLAANIRKANAELRAFAQATPNVRYFDANEYLCPGGTCSAFEPNGEPKYYDGGHLTAAQSTKLGTRILAKEGVPAPFASIPGWRTNTKAGSVAGMVGR